MHRRSFLARAGTAALALATPQVALGASRRQPLTLVTADLEAHVVAVAADDGRVIARIPTPAGPRSIEAVRRGTLALVAHTTEGLVSLVDASTLRVRRVLDGFAEPRYTAAGPSGRYSFVSDARLGQVVVVDLLRERIAARVEVGSLARHITIAPHGRSLWVALGPQAAAIAVVDLDDPTRPRLRGRVLPVDLAHDVVYGSDGSRVWVTSGSERAVAVHDGRTGRPLLRLPGGAPPQHAAILGAHAYVASGDDGALRVHALEDGRVVRESRIPVGSYNVTAGSDRVYTPSLDVGTLCIVRASGRLQRRERLARSSHDACVVNNG
jgi:DNA-binding beta-propeller fold protein YncE